MFILYTAQLILYTSMVGVTTTKRMQVVAPDMVTAVVQVQAMYPGWIINSIWDEQTPPVVS